MNRLAGLGRSGIVALAILGGVTAIAGTGVFASGGADDGPLHDINDDRGGDRPAGVSDDSTATPGASSTPRAGGTPSATADPSPSADPSPENGDRRRGRDVRGDDDDHSGRGRAGDDDDDNKSGPGNGEHDNSGHRSGDDDND